MSFPASCAHGTQISKTYPMWHERHQATSACAFRKYSFDRNQERAVYGASEGIFSC